MNWGPVTMTETMTTEHETEQMPVDPIELLTAGDLARRLRISIRQIRKLHSDALMPAPLRLGRSARWRKMEIGEWLAAGCPDRKAWETMQNGHRGSGN